MRKKLQRFADNAARANIIEPGKSLYETVKGRWRTAYFHNSGELVLELGCGKAAYTLGLSQQFPAKNFVGVDIKGARLWAGSTVALTQDLHQAAFLRTKIEHLDRFFAPREVDEIYIPFPDPRPRDRDIKRRLTSPRMLAIYRELLKPGGWIHLKTDNEALFQYTLEILATESITDLVHTSDLYQSEWLDTHYGIQTDYEKQFLAQGVTIKYLRFALEK